MTPAISSKGRNASYTLPAPRPHRLATLLLVSLAVIFAIDTGHKALCSEKCSAPNVVVILADDLGYADVGFNGCKDIPTPHLDRLAASGLRCTNGYVSHPFCSPTRAGLMTGRYQQRFGHENNPRFDPHDTKLGLPLDQVTIAQLMKQAGYTTIAIGKWHLGAAPQFHPNRRGFDEYFGFLGGGHDYFKAVPDENRVEYQIPVQHNGQPVPIGEYLTDTLTKAAVDFVRQYREKPFYLYLAYNAPHTPLQATEKYLKRTAGIADEKRRVYGAMVCAVDDGVGLLLDTLRELQLDRRTLIFFLSDNGGPIAVTHSSNAPLRGAKGDVYDGGIRVPFVVSWPGQLAAGKDYPQPVICLDILPTALAAAGAAPPANLKLDGVNLLPYLRGEQSGAPHNVLFWRSGGGQRFAVRQGTAKLDGQAEKDPELYDLASDIGEAKNLAAGQPHDVAKLMQTSSQWNAQLKAPLWENPQRAAAVKRPARKAAGKPPATD